MNRFAYHRADSVEHALQLLAWAPRRCRRSASWLAAPT